MHACIHAHSFVQPSTLAFAQVASKHACTAHSFVQESLHAHSFVQPSTLAYAQAESNHALHVLYTHSCKEAYTRTHSCKQAHSHTRRYQAFMHCTLIRARKHTRVIIRALKHARIRAGSKHACIACTAHSCTQARMYMCL